MSTSPSENPVFTFARVDPETLKITLSYNTNGGDRWAPDDLECTIPFDVLADTAVRSDSGEIVLTEDPAKVAQKTAQVWTAIRTERNARLSASDWTRLDDVKCDKEAWAEYRQSLRDLPSTVTEPTNVTWPAPPP